MQQNFLKNSVLSIYFMSGTVLTASFAFAYLIIRFSNKGIEIHRGCYLPKAAHPEDDRAKMWTPALSASKAQAQDHHVLIVRAPETQETGSGEACNNSVLSSLHTSPHFSQEETLGRVSR